MRRSGLARTIAFSALIGISALILSVSSVYTRQNSQPNIRDVVRTVESRYHDSHTLKAVFFERYNEGRLTTRIESGTAYFSRPGRMRWEYESPEEKLFLTDGKTTWFYIPADHTVSRISMKESNDWRTPLSLLTGKANLTKYCKRIDFGDPPHDNPANVTLRCVPAGAAEVASKARRDDLGASDQALSPDTGGQIQIVLLEVAPRTGWLASVIIRQSGGVQVEYRFGRWEANIEVPETMFHFVAPKGVAIVNGDAPGSPLH
jgi:outer membrane lipoprotein carrier protein